MSYVTITYLPITAIDDIYVQEKLFPSSIFLRESFLHFLRRIFSSTYNYTTQVLEEISQLLIWIGIV